MRKDSSLQAVIAIKFPKGFFGTVICRIIKVKETKRPR